MADRGGKFRYGAGDELPGEGAEPVGENRIGRRGARHPSSGDAHQVGQRGAGQCKGRGARRPPPGCSPRSEWMTPSSMSVGAATYIEEGVIHLLHDNIPGAVASHLDPCTDQRHAAYLVRGGGAG